MDFRWPSGIPIGSHFIASLICLFLSVASNLHIDSQLSIAVDGFGSDRGPLLGFTPSCLLRLVFVDGPFGIFVARGQTNRAIR